MCLRAANQRERKDERCLREAELPGFRVRWEGNYGLHSVQASRQSRNSERGKTVLFLF